MSKSTKPEYWCPRREETGSTAYGPDTLDVDAGCSYCGSMHPDVFMEIARGNQPGTLGPTDKSYKVYVEDTGRGFGKFYFQHLTVDQRREFVDLYNERPRRTYDDSLTFTGGEGKGMQVGYPGYFYARVFFMSHAG